MVRGGTKGRRTPPPTTHHHPDPCKKREMMWTRPLSLLYGEESHEKGWGNLLLLSPNCSLMSATSSQLSAGEAACISSTTVCHCVSFSGSCYDSPQINLQLPTSFTTAKPQVVEHARQEGLCESETSMIYIYSKCHASEGYIVSLNNNNKTTQGLEIWLSNY